MNWIVHSQGTDPPANALISAKEDAKTQVLVGRVNNHDNAFVGKWTPKNTNGMTSDVFFYNYNEVEVSDVTTYDLLVC